MARFHVNSGGRAGLCKATSGRCPYGGSDGTANHYDSMADAATAAMAAELGQPSAPHPVSVHGAEQDTECILCGTDVGNLWDAWCKPCALREFDMYLEAKRS